MDMATVDLGFTVKEAAARLALSDSRVRQLCIQHNIGVIRGRDRFLSDDDIDVIRKMPRKMGRPRKVAVPS